MAQAEQVAVEQAKILSELTIAQLQSIQGMLALRADIPSAMLRPIEAIVSIAIQHKEAAKPGGIDFNPDALDLRQQGEPLNFVIDEAMLGNIQPNDVFGIQPIIINITPLTSFAPLLGLKEDEEEVQKISKL